MEDMNLILLFLGSINSMGKILRKRVLRFFFFSYFYLVFNFGFFFLDILLGYVENEGKWEVGFWVFIVCVVIVLVLFFCGIFCYRYFKLRGNFILRFFKVFVILLRKWKVFMLLEGEGLYELDDIEYL